MTDEDAVEGLARAACCAGDPLDSLVNLAPIPPPSNCFRANARSQPMNLFQCLLPPNFALQTSTPHHHGKRSSTFSDGIRCIYPERGSSCSRPARLRGSRRRLPPPPRPSSHRSSKNGPNPAISATARSPPFPLPLPAILRPRASPRRNAIELMPLLRPSLPSSPNRCVAPDAQLSLLASLPPGHARPPLSEPSHFSLFSPTLSLSSISSTEREGKPHPNNIPRCT